MAENSGIDLDKFSSNLSNLLSGLINNSLNKKFYIAEDKDARILYCWQIDNLSSTEKEFLKNINLKNKTLKQAAEILEIRVRPNDIKDSDFIVNACLNTDATDNTEYFVILMDLSGTIRSYYPFMNAVHNKFPQVKLSYIAFHDNINSYNYYGGPWYGGIKRSEILKDSQFLVYYLSSDQNKSTLIDSKDQSELKKWLDNNVKGLINYKTIPLDAAQKLDIDWDKQSELAPKELFINPDDSRFKEAKKDKNRTVYAWRLENLLENEFKIISNLNLKGKTINEAIDILNLNVRYGVFNDSALINTSTELNEDGKSEDLMIYMLISGEVNPDNAFINALHNKFLNTRISFVAFPDNINSYNYYGGPWYGGVHSFNKVLRDKNYLVYYLAENENSFKLFENNNKKKIEAWLIENVNNLINYKIISTESAQKLDIKF